MSCPRVRSVSLAQRWKIVDWEHPSLSMARQCALLGVSRSGLYYRLLGVSGDDPFLMRTIGLRAIYRSPRTSRPAPEHRVYPYLLENIRVTLPNQAWAADITYLPMARGFPYLVTIMNWHSRYVVAWRLSNTLEADFCVDALKEAQRQGQPEVFNTDEGSQFTSREFTQVLQDRGVKISMDGKGRYADNIFAERLWRTVKYEEVYLKAYVNAGEAPRELGSYFRFNNNQRPHQALGYRTPAEVFHGEQEVGDESNDRRCSLRTGSVLLAGAPGLSLNSTPVLSN